MICTLCFMPFDERDSIGSGDALCQDCWESATSLEWWETVVGMQKLISVEATSCDTGEWAAPTP